MVYSQPELGKKHNAIGLRTSMERDYYKRPFDLLILLAAHLFLFPIFLILWVVIPLAIWMEDRGPVFYSQLRVGKNGKIFKLFKFRSMVPNAEDLTGPIWALEDDHRITKVGEFLRKRALDELPQVINLIRGDLSLVGPRPERPALLEEIRLYLPSYDYRLSVRPGLTGFAQVHGRYRTRPKHKLIYDRFYISKMNPILDIRLLTFSVIYTIKARWQENEK